MRKIEKSYILIFYSSIYGKILGVIFLLIPFILYIKYGFNSVFGIKPMFYVIMFILGISLTLYNLLEIISIYFKINNSKIIFYILILMIIGPFILYNFGVEFNTVGIISSIILFIAGIIILFTMNFGEDLGENNSGFTE